MILGIKPFDNIGGHNSRFMGFGMCQNRYAVAIWSYLLEIWKPAVIVEIGTYDGGFTCCLGIAGKNHKFPVHSWDVNAFNEDNKGWFDFLGINFHEQDAFSDDAQRAIDGLIQGAKGPALVLCDGGNKMLELTFFAAMLRKGDVIAAHDLPGPSWGWGEITVEQTEALSLQHSLDVFHPELFEHSGWLVRQKVDPPDRFLRRLEERLRAIEAKLTGPEK